jgi:lipopolysaccharide export system protein LptC
VKKARNLVAFCVFALAFVMLFFFFINWRGDRFDGISVKIPTIKADLEVGNLFLTEEKEGAIRWQMEAKIAERYKKGKKTFLEDLRVTLYGEDGRVVTLQGDKGRIDEKTRDMEVNGDVVVTSSDGLRLETTSLKYNHSRREITTDAPVRIDGRGITISGVGLLMELATEKVSILKDVETSIDEFS